MSQNTDQNTEYMTRYNALLEKLKAADNWQTHLPEVIEFFGQNRRFVVVESPFAAPTQEEIDANLAYARAACHDALVNHGEIPFASHIKYTQPGILDDTIEWERSLGIAAGLAEGLLADKTAVYVDRGFSTGMLKGIEAALKAGRKVQLRSLAETTEASANAVAEAKIRLVAAMGSIALDVEMFSRKN